MITTRASKLQNTLPEMSPEDGHQRRGRSTPQTAQTDIWRRPRATPEERHLLSHSGALPPSLYAMKVNAPVAPTARVCSIDLPRTMPPSLHHILCIAWSGIASARERERGIPGKRDIVAIGISDDHLLLGEINSILNPPSRSELYVPRLV